MFLCEQLQNATLLSSRKTDENKFVLKTEYTYLKLKHIIRDFKNGTFYIDCFFYGVDLMLFPMQCFILSHDIKQ